MARNYAKKKKSHKAATIMILGIVAVFCVIMHMSNKGRQEELDKLNDTINKYDNLIEDENDRTLELEKLKVKVTTKEYIIQRGRQLGLVFPNEIVFKPE